MALLCYQILANKVIIFTSLLQSKIILKKFLMDFNGQGIFKSFQYEKLMSIEFEEITFNSKFYSADDEDDQIIEF